MSVCGSLSTWINWIGKKTLFLFPDSQWLCHPNGKQNLVRPLPPHNATISAFAPRSSFLLSIPTLHTFRCSAAHGIFHLSFQKSDYIYYCLVWLGAKISWHRRRQCATRWHRVLMCVSDNIYQQIARQSRLYITRPWLIELFKRGIIK